MRFFCKLLIAGTFAAALTTPLMRAQQPQIVMRDQSGRPFQGVAGPITAISGDSIKLKSFQGGEVTVKITKDTQFRRDREAAKLQDFKVGETVMVRGTPSGEGEWTAQMIATRGDAQPQFRGEMGKQFVIGEVKSLDPPKLTVLRPDGVTQTIEADENTSLKKMNESITMADIQPGDRLFARGELKNGVFVPLTIVVGNAEQMRFGQRGGAIEGQKQPASKSDEKPKQ